MKKEWLLSCLLIGSLLVGCGTQTNETPGGSPATNIEDKTDPEVNVDDEIKKMDGTSPYTDLNTLDGVTMEVIPESVLPNSMQIKITDTNDTPFVYGEQYEIEKNLEGTWYRLPVVVEGDYGFNELGYLIGDDKTLTMKVNFEWLYGTLSDGNYRIVKAMYVGDSKYEYISADFTVSNTVMIDISQYETLTLDIKSIEDDSFTGTTPWPLPNIYNVKYKLGDKFCVGDRVTVYYSSMEEVDDMNENGFRTINLTGEFVDVSDFELDPNVSYKPVIYLYPEDTMDVNVTLDLDGKLTYTCPLYEDGWKITAAPDGTLTDETGTKYPYLFWEGEVTIQADLSKGFCIKGTNTSEFLNEALLTLGLNEQECADFLEFWLPFMEKNPYNLITFQTDTYTDAAKLNISPAPDSVLRVYMVFMPLQEEMEVEAPVLKGFDRTGFSVVEWGGSVRYSK